MNFGAYHTFAETIPIGMAVANDQDYNPSDNTDLQHKDLYDRVGGLANDYAGENAATALAEFKKVHAQEYAKLSQGHPELAVTSLEKKFVDDRELDAARMPFYTTMLLNY